MNFILTFVSSQSQRDLVQFNDFLLMKKYSSYKNLKPICNPYPKTPVSPTYNSSYKKLGLVDLSVGRHHQKIEVYPSSTKYSTSSNVNASNYINTSNRKKMFSNKKQYADTPITGNYNTGNKSPLSLIYRPNEETPSGYQNIKTKINDLESRLQQIKKNYDASYIRKQGQKSLKLKQKENNQRVNNNSSTYNNSIKNKENEQPKQKKTQSNLLLERYQQKKLNRNQNSSTINLYNGDSINSNKTFEQPLSSTNKIRMEKRQTTQCIQSSVQPQKKVQQRSDIEKLQKVAKNNNLNDQQSTYLKEFVTTFTCENKVSISHSSSQTNLFKPSNKLATTTKNHKYYVASVLNAFSNQKPTSFDNLCRNHLTTSIDILQYIKNSNKQPPSLVKARPLPKTHKQTIIFDLDETLIHCNENLTVQHDVALPIKFPNGSIIKAGINVRPYAKQCLRQLAKHFQIIVFTASHQCYGTVIVDYLDPKRQFVAHSYFRDSCYKTEEGFYVKDLRIVDRDLKNVLLIDNAAYSYCFQLDNGVPIVPFYDNKADLQLKNLIPYLKQFLSQKDVRIRNSMEMKLTYYTNFKDARMLISKLYSTQDQNQN